MIFERLTQIIVSSANLLEAETDRIQQKIFLLVISLFFVFVGVCIALLGIYFLGQPVYQWLIEQLSLAAAQGIVGGLLVIIAGGLIWKSLKLLS